MRKYCILLIIFINIIIIPQKLYPSEQDSIELTKFYYSQNQFFNTINEIKRYQFQYPDGKFSAESFLLLGKAYFKGNNFNLATDSFTSCYHRYSDKPEGEESLFLLGYMRLKYGSVNFALQTLQDYLYLYPNNKYTKKAGLFECYASALSDDLHKTNEIIQNYKNKYPDIINSKELQLFEKTVMDEINRPIKSVWISVLGSILIPGFGHFYTGKYKEGVLSFISNALLIFLIYDGYRNNNKFQMAFCSIMELTFYQYSLYGAIRDVYEYNNKDKFYNHLKLQMSAEF